MSDTAELFKLFESAPKDKDNVFISDPKTDAFFDELARSAPLTPLELLDLADEYHKHPATTAIGDRIMLNAIGAIGHDRRALQILSSVANEGTAWGVSVHDLLARVTKSYANLSPRWIGESGGSGVSKGPNTTITYAYTPAGSGCTFTPPSGGAPITLASKQQWSVTTLTTVGTPTRSVMTVTCLNFNAFGPTGLYLQIEIAKTVYT